MGEGGKSKEIVLVDQSIRIVGVNQNPNGRGDQTV